MNNIKYIFYILFFCVSCLCHASSIYTFKRISALEGLSQTTVYSICQDSLGYIWIGTQDGLNKYNGHNMVVYESDSQDSTSLSSSFVKSLFVDSKNNIWVGGHSNISRYSYEQDRFKRYELPNIDNDSEINNICTDSQNIWASSQKGDLYIYNEKTDLFEPIVYQQNGVDKRISIQKIKDVGEYLYICGFDGLYKLNKQTRQLIPLYVNNPYSEIHDFVFDTNNEIWLGTREQGLIHLDQNFKLVKQFIHKNNENSIIGNKIRTLTINHAGEILIGTFFGLSVFNPVNGKFANYTNQSNDTSTLTNNSIFTIFIDKNNGTWIGTSIGGINYYHKDNNRFSHIYSNSKPYSLINNPVNCIVQQKQYIWFGYNGDGITRFNISTKEIEHFFTDNQGNPISKYKNISAILPLPDGSLLLGSLFGGVIYFNPQTRQTRAFYKKEESQHSLKDNRTTTLYRDKENNIWVGTYDGLFLFNIKDLSFYSFEELYPSANLSSKEIYCIMEDRHKRLWIGTANGLNRFDPYKKKMELFAVTKDSLSITSNRISSMYEDSRGRIWIGTSKGINMFKEGTENFIHLTSEEGLPNDMVLAIIEDNSGHLWISTNKGLTRINPETFYNESFTKEDGLKNERFLTQSAIKLPNGELMFGGINGVTLFNPEEIVNSTINQKVLFSDLYVGGQRILPHDQTGILSNHIAKTKEIKLNYNQRNFSIYFSAINFNQQSVVYQYKLDQNNSSWMTTDKNYISFFNLNDGKYKLFVKVVPLNNAKDEQYTTLNITIRPPWWRSYWMYLLYIITGSIIIYSIYLKIQSNIRRKNERLANAIEKEKLKEFQKMRQQLFINIAHELKTPLSLIISPLQELYRQILIDKRTRMCIDMAYTNSCKLNELINQLIDFSKAEQDDINPAIQKGNMRNVLYKTYLSFSSVADAKEIKYNFNVAEEPTDVFFDPYIIERIVTNLLSNAFKFTPNKGKIDIKATYEKEHCHITVTDSGSGISEEKIERIFERYYTTLSDSGGSGIGLAFVKHLVALHKGDISVESIKGEGTTFTVNIPINLPPANKDSLSAEYEQKPVINDDMPEPSTCIIKHHILIVDDNVDMAKYLQNYYGQTNVVSVAYNASQAIELLSEHAFDIVISDVMMPDINGFTLCKRIKHNPETSNIVCILLTALCDAEFIVKGIHSGADDYITKPFSLEVLDAKLSNIIALKRRRANPEVLTNAPNTPIYTSLEEEFVLKVTQIINAHLEDAEYRITDLAEELCMSPSKLNRKFMDIVGKPPIEFIKKVRLQQAKTLLDSQRYSISEICYMVGFSTPTYFSICFKKEFGYSPSSYLSKKTES